MIVSLNEIEQTVLKATRGAGRSWGDAEEIAAAARWLALHHEHLQSWDWLASLVAALATDCGTTSAVNRSPAFSDSEVFAHGLKIMRARDPLWLVAFAAGHAIGARRTCTLTWGQARLDVDATGTLSAAAGNIVPNDPVDVTIIWSDAASRLRAQTPPRTGGRSVDDALWQHLDRLGSKTYVPASDHSRQSGAGATTSDND